MMSFDWISFIAGLIIGWILEWVLDYFYWRNKRSGGEDVSELEGKLQVALARNEELQASLLGAQSEVTDWQARFSNLQEQAQELEVVQSDLVQCRTNYADLEADYAQLRTDLDDLQHAADEARIRAIGRLTAIEGIDESQAGRLYDAGIVDREGLIDADDTAVKTALDFDDDEFDTWNHGVKAALLGLGLAYAVGDDEDVDYSEHEVVDDAVRAAAIDLGFDDDELDGELITEQVMETFDFDEDGEVDLVLETTTQGLDFDYDGEIDEIVDQTVQADILDEEAVAAEEDAVEADIAAELDAMAVEDELAAREAAAIIIPDDAPDDLTLIQGIGPRYAEKLNDNGILTFAALAAASDDDLDLAIQPQSWQKVDYDAWRSQAGTFASVELPVIVGDDLLRIEGIGPKYAETLRSADILTYAELADTDPERLATIIAAPPWRKIDFDAWIAQAGLAAAGDEEGLAVMQAELNRPGDDNLLLIRGIGPTYYQALRDEGLTTFSDLAAKTPEQVEAIIVAAGLRHANFAAWIEEAEQRMTGARIPRQERIPADAVLVACPQDLERIEGVGIIFERRLYEAHIGSYWAVAQLSDEALSEILQVKPFQDVDLAAIRASAMALALETGTVNNVWDGSVPDDFEPMAGIGVVYERRLYEAGYCTYEALAGATAAELEIVCRPPASSKPDFESWIATAKRLAEERGADES